MASPLLHQSRGLAAPSQSSASLAPLWLEPHRYQSGALLPDSHRDRGIHWVAGSGSGKSLGLGLLAFLDLLRGVPQVLFDPAGQAIDALLLRIALFSPPVRRQLWPQLRYVDLSSATGCVVRLPLLFRLPGDHLKDVADRFLETCRAIDPQLTSASIQGYNALYRVGAPTGMILAALGMQLDQAPALLDDPEGWLPKIEEAVARDPEARPAADFFRNEYLPVSLKERLALSHAYRAKVEPILLDPIMSAMLCGTQADLEFGQVVAGRQTVLLDLRGLTNPRTRLLVTRWFYDCLLAFVRARGPGRHRPLAVHFDEITELTNQASAGQELFTQDLDYLFNVLQRNYSLWITAAHQQMWQLPPQTQETLLSLGTQLVGALSDMPTAELLARRYARLDPYQVKRTENVWASESLDDGFGRSTNHFVIDQRIVDMPLEEQVFLAARRFLELPPFEFYLKPRNGNRLRRVSMRPLLEGIWPSDYDGTLAHIRARLAMRSGHLLPAPPPLILPQSGIMYSTNGHVADDLAQSDQDYWDTWPKDDAPATP